MLHLDNEGQGHGVQHSKWSNSVAKINLYESHTWELFARFHVFEIFRFQNCDLESVDQGQDGQHS